MKKKLKLGFVGSHVRMELIREIIPVYFPEIRADIYENDCYEYDHEMEQDLLALKRRVNGVVFGGELQFKLYQGIFEPDTPCTFLQKNSVSLLNSFLALSWHGVNISRISVDNYSPATIICTAARTPALYACSVTAMFRSDRAVSYFSSCFMLSSDSVNIRDLWAWSTVRLNR